MKTQLMAILNVTPDSAYPQARWPHESEAIEQGLNLYKQGADILDIGGESTRPHATPVEEKEELRRVIPVIKALKKAIPIPLSIDTFKPAVARAALEAGATFINDISGFSDPAMLELAVEAQIPICVMHMQGTPQTMQIQPFYEQGVIPTLIDWFQKKVDLLLKKGVKAQNIFLDPGVGFGKTVDHNVEIIDNLQKIKALGFPVLVGCSRKSFLGKLLNKPIEELLPATLTVNMLAIQAQVEIIRVHDVIAHRDVIDLMHKMSRRENLNYS